jgi:peptidyl-prolyl cis-trans isomerase SurA
MSRRGWLAATWATLTLAACGCLVASPRSQAEQGSEKGLTDLQPTPAQASATGRDTARAQMPEANSGPARGNEKNAVCRLINLPVDRPAEAVHANPATKIRAVVNGDLILEEEALLSCQMTYELLQQMQAARSRGNREAVEAVIKQAVEELIDRELLLQDASAKLKRGGKHGEALLKQIEESADEAFIKSVVRPKMKEWHLSTRAEVSAYLRQRGMSLDLMRRWWERNWMAQGYLHARLEQHLSRIGRIEITEYYDNHRDEFTQPDSIDWQDIFLDAGRHASRAAARQFAEALVERVRQGEEFAKLSHEFDNGESGRFRKGAGQGHKHGEIFPSEAEPFLFRMHEGDLEIIECPHGYHVVHLVKRQYAGAIPFDAKVQKEIRDKLRNQVVQRERESIVKELKRKAVIDRCD